MNIEHIAIWTKNLEALRDFYVTYFQATAGPKYVNLQSGFESFFLTFSTGARLELMSMPGITHPGREPGKQFMGYIHLALSTGSESAVDALTGDLRHAGYPVLDGPRRTGDGYYESVILDPDGNRVEITV